MHSLSYRFYEHFTIFAGGTKYVPIVYGYGSYEKDGQLREAIVMEFLSTGLDKATEKYFKGHNRYIPDYIMDAITIKMVRYSFQQYFESPRN